MAKTPQELYWIEELLPQDELRRKAMFGGFGYYLGERMVLLLFESKGSKSYKGQNYEFELWNGCMFPLKKEHHPETLKKLPFLVNHPILPKWLYLPMETENFEELVTDVLRQVLKPSSVWGTSTGQKTKQRDILNDKSLDKLDTRTPRMFADEPAEERFAKAKRIMDLKNIGSQTQEYFLRAGIKTPQQFIKLGWKKTLEKMVVKTPKTLHTMWAYTLVGALTNRDWNLLTDVEKQECKDFVKDLRSRLETKTKKPKKTAVVAKKPVKSKQKAAVEKKNS